MQKPKPFAKLFDHPEIGQVLVRRTTNKSGTPGVLLMFNAAANQLQLCDLFFAQGGIDEEVAARAADKLLDSFTEAMAVDLARKYIEYHKQDLQAAR